MMLTSAQTPADLRQREKRVAAERSLDFVRPGMCLGLGSGSTAAIMLELLGQRVAAGLQISGVPTSEESRRLALAAGIPLVDFDQVVSLDVTIDGADEADGEMNLIKGGHGALLREKIVASLSQHVVIIADASKQVDCLGAFPLPVEVVRFAWRPVAERLRDLELDPVLRRDSQSQPFVTDEGNYILDCRCIRISDPVALAARLSSMPGVMEHGLFVDLADTLIIGRDGEAEVQRRGDRIA